MVGIMLKRQPLAVMVKPTTASVQISVRGTTGAVWCVFFGESFCPELSVRLHLINMPYTKFAIFKIGTSPQRIFNLGLRQNKSGGRFFALRSVDMFNLLGFGGDDSIQKT